MFSFGARLFSVDCNTCMIALAPRYFQYFIVLEGNTLQEIQEILYYVAEQYLM